MEEKNKNKTNKQTKGNARFVALIIVLIVIIVIAVVAIVNKNGDNTDDETIYGDNGEGNSVVEELGEYESLQEDGSKINTSSALSETKTLTGLEVTDSQLTYANGIAVLIANVTNVSDEDIATKTVKIDIIDDEGEVLLTVNGVIESTSPGETVQLNMSVSADIANAYDFTIYE